MSYLSGWYFVVYLLAFPPQAVLRAITGAEAKAHVGERAKVCGVIASLYEPRGSSRSPTMLNFDKQYPRNEFTAIIWKWQRHRFPDRRALVKKKVCVTGEVREYRGRAEITLREREQLNRRL